jgi:hypothetical protein
MEKRGLKIQCHIYDLQTDKPHTILDNWTHVNVNMKFLIKGFIPNPLTFAVNCFYNDREVYRESLFNK